MLRGAQRRRVTDGGVGVCECFLGTELQRHTRKRDGGDGGVCRPGPPSCALKNGGRAVSLMYAFHRKKSVDHTHPHTQNPSKQKPKWLSLIKLCPQT